MSMKRGQVTIFVIVGVIILMSIILFFFIFAKDFSVDRPGYQAPRNTIELCVRDALNPSIFSVLEYGGLIEPRFFIKRNNHSYNYLCYTDVYYTKCKNYFPMLRKTSEGQIRGDSIDRVEKCFDFLVEEYESGGYDVESGDLEYAIEIVPGSVRLTINKLISASKGDSAHNFENFNMKIPSDLYELINIARKIVDQEAGFCYFEHNGFMALYPNYNITRFDYLETKIYEVQNINTKEVLKFATRSCPYAPGFSGSEFL